MPFFDTEKCASTVFDSPLRQILEKYDRKANALKMIGFAVIIAGIFTFFIESIESPVHFFIIFAGVFILGISGRGRRTFFRTVIIPELLKQSMPSLKYQPHSGISRTKFSSYRLFPSFDRYDSEDKLSGKLGNTTFTAAEVHIEKEQNSKNGKTYRTIFRGILFIADFNKELNSRTVVLPDTAERCFGKLIGNFFQQMNFTKGSLVKLENPEFEKHFAVYSCSQIEARYILTPQMMERLVRLRNKYKAKIRLLFENDHAIIAIPKSSGWLEPPFFGSLARLDVLKNILVEIEDVLSIIDDLDLNTRIWTKK